MVKMEKEIAVNQLHQGGRQPSFISHPNGILLRVLNQKRSTSSSSSSSSLIVKRKMETKTDQQHAQQLKRIKQRDEQRLSFISHPNGILLCVLNRKRSTSSTLSPSLTNTQYDTEGVICSDKLYVIYYPPGRDWG